MVKTHFVILFTVCSLSLCLARAQDSEKLDGPLSKKQAGQTLKLAEEALENAERAQRRGDTLGMERALENYTLHMNKLERGIHEGNVLHDDHGDVSLMVFDATEKHRSVLEDLDDKVSAQGWDNGISKHALEESIRGHETAFQNLTKEQREELTKRDERQRGPSSTTSHSNNSLHGSSPSTGPGTAHGPATVGGPGGGGSQKGQGRGRR